MSRPIAEISAPSNLSTWTRWPKACQQSSNPTAQIQKSEALQQVKKSLQVWKQLWLEGLNKAWPLTEVQPHGCEFSLKHKCGKFWAGFQNQAFSGCKERINTVVHADLEETNPAKPNQSHPVCNSSHVQEIMPKKVSVALAEAWLHWISAPTGTQTPATFWLDAWCSGFPNKTGHLSKRLRHGCVELIADVLPIQAFAFREFLNDETIIVAISISMIPTVSTSSH